MSDEKASNFKIRWSVESDVEQIYDMSIELNIYLDFNKHNILSCEQFKSDYKKSLFEVFVAEDLCTSNLVGFLLFYKTYTSTSGTNFLIEDLYVKEKYRNYKIGKALFSAISQHALDSGIPRMDLFCQLWNESSMKIYEKLNFENISKTEGVQLFKIAGDDIKKLADSNIKSNILTEL